MLQPTVVAGELPSHYTIVFTSEAADTRRKIGVSNWSPSYPLRRTAKILSVERAAAAGLEKGCVMRYRNFYALGVEDLKPIPWHNFGETSATDELVYLVDPVKKDVVIANVCVGVKATTGPAVQA